MEAAIRSSTLAHGRCSRMKLPRKHDLPLLKPDHPHSLRADHAQIRNEFPGWDIYACRQISTNGWMRIPAERQRTTRPHSKAGYASIMPAIALRCR